MREETRKEMNDLVTEYSYCALEDHFDEIYDLALKSGPIKMKDLDETLKDFSLSQVMQAINLGTHFSIEDRYFIYNTHTSLNGEVSLDMVYSSSNILDLLDVKRVLRQARKEGLIDKSYGPSALRWNTHDLFGEHGSDQLNEQIWHIANSIDDASMIIDGHPEVKDKSQAIATIKTAIDELIKLDEQIDSLDISYPTAHLTAICKVFFE